MTPMASAVARPWLVRRLVLAQLVTRACLGVAVVVFFVSDAASNDASHDPRLMAARAAGGLARARRSVAATALGRR